MVIRGNNICMVPYANNIPWYVHTLVKHFLKTIYNLYLYFKVSKPSHCCIGQISKTANTLIELIY